MFKHRRVEPESIIIILSALANTPAVPRCICETCHQSLASGGCRLLHIREFSKKPPRGYLGIQVNRSLMFKLPFWSSRYLSLHDTFQCNLDLALTIPVYGLPLADGEPVLDDEEKRC